MRLFKPTVEKNEKAGPNEPTTLLGKRLYSKSDIKQSNQTWNNQPVDISVEGSAKQLMHWRNATSKLGLAPIEFLLPSINVAFIDKLPSSMEAAEEAYRRKPNEVDQLLKHKWGYYYYLGGGFSTKTKEHGEKDARAQSILRISAINETVSSIFGEDIGDQSVLDMACNWGGMAMDMAYRGCDSLGIDIREENILKANALASYLQLPNARFQQADVMQLDRIFSGQRFDIIFNLGLMYHLTAPYEAMEITYQLCNKVAVIDTNLSHEAYSGFALVQTTKVGQPTHAHGSKDIELKPTYRAIIDMMVAVGFKDLIEITVSLGPDFPNGPSRKVMETYNRRRIIGFK